MTAAKNLLLFKEGKRIKAEDLAVALTGEDSKNNGIKLLKDSATLGMSIEATLLRYVEPLGEGANQLNGLEATFQKLNIPLNLSNDEHAHAVFAASTDSFMTSEGLKPLLPVLINNILRAKDNTLNPENVEDLLANTRTVKGNQFTMEVVYDKNTADSYGTSRVAEGARIPVRSLKTTQTGVSFFKHGSGIEVSYEFARRMSPDVLVPMANRVVYERSQSEAAGAVEILIGGDGNKGAATVETLQSFDGAATGKLRNRAEGFIKWLMAAAKARRPIDTLVVGWDSLFELQFMFPVQNVANVPAVGVGNIATGAGIAMNVNLVGGVQLPLKIVLSSTMEPNQILGYRKGETLERLIEQGSQIQETERSILNQTLLYVNTTNSGFSLFYDESRRLLTWADA